MTATDRRTIAAEAIRRAVAEGLPTNAAGMFDRGGLTLYAAVMEGRDPDEALDEWRRGRE